jgi:hypothetical protein
MILLGRQVQPHMIATVQPGPRLEGEVAQLTEDAIRERLERQFAELCDKAVGKSEAHHRCQPAADVHGDSRLRDPVCGEDEEYRDSRAGRAMPWVLPRHSC